MDKKRKRTIMQFLSGKGFYIALFLCVAAIGIAGYMVLFSENAGNTVSDRRETIKPIQSPAATDTPAEQILPKPSADAGTGKSGTDTPKESASAFSGRDSGTSGGSGAAAADREEPGGTAVTQAEPAVQQPAPGSYVDESTLETGYNLPVEGRLAKGYSLDALQYNETLGDWRVHTGVDILAAEGSEVTAVSSGTVTGVYQDDAMGNTVVVRHPDGVSSTYSNLSPEVRVSEGETVEGGQLLGYVGSSALSESSQQPHLHFEMAYEGVSIDPLDILRIE